MKNKKILKIILLTAVLTLIVGTTLNCVVKSLNQGMPSNGCTVAYGRYVPINQGTKLVFLADVIPVGNYVLSLGDLFFITGILACLTAIWIALPQGRKFFPFLIVSVVWIILFAGTTNDMKSTFLCEIAAVLSICAVYWSYRSNNNEEVVIQKQVANMVSNAEYDRMSTHVEGCLCKEGAKQCVWWVTHEFNNELKGYCANPYITIQTKTACNGSLNRYVINREAVYSKISQVSKLGHRYQN